MRTGRTTRAYPRPSAFIHSIRGGMGNGSVQGIVAENVSKRVSIGAYFSEHQCACRRRAGRFARGLALGDAGNLYASKLPLTGITGGDTRTSESAADHPSRTASFIRTSRSCWPWFWARRPLGDPSATHLPRLMMSGAHRTPLRPLRMCVLESRSSPCRDPLMSERDFHDLIVSRPPRRFVQNEHLRVMHHGSR